MVRQVNFFPSTRLLFTALSALCLSASLSGQSNASLHSLAPPVSRFVVPTAYALSSSPTSIAVGDLNGDGHPDLVLTEKASGSVTVLLGDGKGGFGAAVTYPAATLAGNVQLADLNHDGKLDAVVTDSATGAVDVLLGNGDGTFGKATSYSAVGNPVALAVGNFAGSGNIDLAVAGSAGLAVLLNDGTGRFSAPAAIALSSTPVSLAASDLRGAGRDDLLLANADGTLSILLNGGAGVFHAQPALQLAAGSLSGVVAADFNGDGRPDLAVSVAGSNALLVLLGHGDGSFASGVSYAVGNSPASLLAADLTGSGVLDLVSVNRAANTFSVLVGNGDGTFHPSSDFASGNGPLAVVAGDFNSDGHADLAVVNSVDATVTLPLGRGDGSFSAPRAYRADLDSRSIAAGDLNGDGRPDLVVANYCGSDVSCASAGTATVFLANPDGTYRAASTLALGSGPVALGLADVNGDKKLDLVALNRNDKTLAVLLGNGDGTFGKAQLYSLADSPHALFVGDLNGDGIPDLAIVSDCGQAACTQPGALDIWLGHAGGTFTQAASYVVGYAPVSIAAADLRSTGHLDLVVANACGDDPSCKSAGTATWFAGDGTGKFTQQSEFTIGSSPSSIAIGNLFDSGLDLVVAERGSNQVAVLPQNGGSFGAPVNYAVGSAPSALAIADFNGDGKPDVAVANFQSSTVSVLYGNGQGSLAAAASYPVGSGPEAMAAVSKTTGAGSALVTANGNSGSDPIGNQITALGGTDPGMGATDITLTSVPGTIAVDGSATISATVSVPPTAAGPTPTGNAIFAIDNGGGNFTSLTDCTGVLGVTLVPLNDDGTVSCSTQQLPAGNPTNVVVEYQGDTNYAANTSADQGWTVTQTGSAVTVGTGTGTVDQSLTLAASVAPNPAPTVANDIVPFNAADTVTFLNGATPITACEGEAITLSATGASASCSTNSLAAGTYSINAQLVASADANYTGSTSAAAGSYTVDPAATAVNVNSVTPSSPTVDQQIAIQATVAPSSGSVVIPFSGNMLFLLGATQICSVPVNTASGNGTTGIAQCAIPAGLAQNSYKVTAQYATGDPNYNPSSSSAFPFSVSVAPTTISISPASLSTTVDNSVTFTATVSPNVSTDEVATGSIQQFQGKVEFLDGGASIGCNSQSVTNTSSGTATATCITSSLDASGSAQSVTATFLGDTNYAASAASNPATSVTVTAATTSTKVTASPAAPALNQSVTFTAQVTFPSTLTVAPNSTDTVTFSDNGAPITSCGTGNPTITEIGSTNVYQATCQIPSLAGGSHEIAAQYNGDSNFLSSTGTLSLSVGAGSSTTTVSSSLNPSTVNAPVTFTVSVAGGSTIAVTGSATVSADGNAIGQCTLSGWSSTTPATCPVVLSTPLSVGSHTITAMYSGNTSYGSSSTTAPLLSQTVNKAATNLTVTSSSTNNTSSINSSVTFSANITLPSGTVTPGGSVAFSYTPSGASSPVTSICSSSGLSLVGTSGGTATYTASCPTSTLPIGTFTITATYSGDGNFVSSSGTTSQTVNTANSTTAVSAELTPSTVDQTVSFQATVSGPSGGQSPTGNVNFTDTVNGTTTPLCSNIGISSGVYVCTASGLIQGTHTITANYPGNSDFQASSAAVMQVVNVAPSSLLLTPTASTVTANNVSTLTFTATVVPSSGPIFATGSVVFTDTSGTTQTPLCTIPLTSGVAMCTPTSLPSGANAIQVSYAGDSNFAPVAAGPTASVAVQDFGLSLSGPPSVNGVPVVTVTQGSTNSNDLFSPVSISANPISISAYSGTLALTCTSPSTGAPKCTPPASLSVASGGSQQGGSVDIDATSASPGSYTFTLTGTDSVTTLTHSLTFTVVVRSLAAPLSLVSGATTGNTANVSFVLPAGVSLSSLECLDVVGTGISTQNVPPSAISVGCTFDPATIASAASLQTGTTVVTVSTSGTTTTGSLDHHSNFLFAGLFAIPIFALLGFGRRRNSIRSILLRLTVIFALAAAAYQVTGCGGSFERPAVTNGQTPAGQYFLLIQGTGTPGNGTYQAVLELNVTL
jgi:hypothetical protein